MVRNCDVGTRLFLPHSGVSLGPNSPGRQREAGKSIQRVAASRQILGDIEKEFDDVGL
jgi:hypothetical protein